MLLLHYKLFIIITYSTVELDLKQYLWDMMQIIN